MEEIILQERIFKLPQDRKEILDPGTFCYLIYNPGYLTKEEKCPICKGKGEITIEGKNFSCPNFCRDGKVIEKTPIGWTLLDFYLSNLDYVTSKLQHVITRTEIEIVDKLLDEVKVMYWFGCNGYPAHNVFKNKADAVRECERRNALLDKNKNNVKSTK